MVKREGADASLKRKDGPSDAGASRKGKEGPSARKLLSASEGTVKFSKIEKERLKRYDRGERNSSKGVGKHELKLKVHRGEKKIGQATQRAQDLSSCARRRSPQAASHLPVARRVRCGRR